ncbi:response regulator transcription factor [Halovulum dunhuangense]|uniref:response regulator transcription factor n=1 Tax=Halovulum dunhuangense TaxID=1505036 RepID=UPI0031B5FF98
MAATRVLVVDDDVKVRRLLRQALESEGFAVVEAADADGVAAALDAREFDLVTLDLTLGNDNGFEIARAIRRKSAVPIIIVSAKTDLIDKVVGLEIGADDFITKPFHMREVVARVRAVLRRSQTAPSPPPLRLVPAQAGPCYAFSGFKAWIDRFELRDQQGRVVDLTSGDFRLLRVFLEHPGRILSRERIMDLLNGTGWSPLDRTVDNQVARLRKKIEEDPSNPRLIKTVRGIGYTFSAPVDLC